MSETLFANKVAFVTGATSGIGRACALAFAGHGAKVACVGRKDEALADVMTEIRVRGGEGLKLKADLVNDDAIDHVLAQTLTSYGGIDILVACAALGAQPLHEMEEEDWRYVVETNLVGYLACAAQAIRRMEQAGGGQLLFVGSISPRIMAPGESVYAATKGGIQSFAETLRKEVGEKNIRVTLIEPGSVGTDMQECSLEEQRAAIARHEMLYAEDVAEAIHFALTRPARCDVLDLRIEPRLQKTA